MDPRNIQEVMNILDQLHELNIRFKLIDERWKISKDIDLIVNRYDFNKFRYIMLKCGLKENKSRSRYGCTFKKTLLGEIINFGPHIGGYNNVFGLRSKKFSRLFEPKKYNEINYLSKEEQVCILLYKISSRSIYSNKGVLSEKYKNYYQDLIKFRLNFERLHNLLNVIFYNSNDVINHLKSKSVLSDYNLDLKNEHVFREKLTFLIRKSLRYIYKTIKPSPYIAIIGTDGSGKTTTAEMLVNRLNNNKIKSTIIYSGRNKTQVLPIRYFGNLIRKRKDKNKLIIKKISKPSPLVVYDSYFIKFATPFVYFLEYWMRYIVRIYSARKEQDIVVTDRAFIDVMVSPNSNKFITKILHNLLPKPIYIFVWAHPKVIEKRKDHPIEDINRQLNLYNKMKPLYSFEICTNIKSPDQIVSEIMSHFEVLGFI